MNDRHSGETFDVLIVGAGHGGVQLAAQLRQRKFAGTIALVGDEAVLPYERPPLSKDYLSGEKGFDRILLKPAAFYADRDVKLLLGRSAGRSTRTRGVSRSRTARRSDTAASFGRLGGHPGG